MNTVHALVSGVSKNCLISIRFQSPFFRLAWQLKTIPNPAAERNKKLMRNGAIAFMVVMMLAAGTMIYLEVGERSAIVTVRVINTQSGASQSYRVKKNEIHSDGFTTMDGMQVFVAGIERIEIESH